MVEQCYMKLREKVIEDIFAEDDLEIFHEGLSELKKLNFPESVIDSFKRGFENYKKIVAETGNYDILKEFKMINPYIQFKEQLIQEIMSEVKAGGKKSRLKGKKSTIKEIEERILRKSSGLDTN